MSALIPPYHFGLVVPDLDEAMHELSALLGLEWHDPVGWEGYQLLHDELVGTDIRFTLSKQGPPYLELITQQPGTVWEHTGLHHMGVFVEDMRAESQRYTDLGVPLEAVGATADGEWTVGCYHHTASDLRIELVDIRTSGPKLIRYLNGGPYA